MCRLLATKFLSQDWRSSMAEGSEVPPKETSAPLRGHQHSVVLTRGESERVDMVAFLRGEEPSLASQDGNEDFVVRSDFVHCARELVVVLA